MLMLDGRRIRLQLAVEPRLEAICRVKSFTPRRCRETSASRHDFRWYASCTAWDFGRRPIAESPCQNCEWHAKGMMERTGI